MKKGKFTLNGKQYMCSVLDDGTRLVDGMTIEEWVATLDTESTTYLFKLGRGIIEGVFQKDFQRIVTELHQIKNN